MSSPQNREKMELATAIECLVAGAARGVKFCELSGGEIFLYFNDLCVMVERAHSLGIETLVETNAFWAKDLATALERLTRLKLLGLTCVRTSMDVFHEEFIPIERVLNVALAGVRCGLNTLVYFLNSSDPEADDRLVSVLRENDLPFTRENVIRAGFAQRNADGCFLEARLRPRDVGSCPAVEITFLPDGNVISCCAPNIHSRRSHLFVGSRNELSIDQLFDRYRDNRFTEVIADPARGFGWLAERLAADGSSLPDMDYATICDFCKACFDPAEFQRGSSAVIPILINGRPIGASS
jgi:hypothetical protein